MKRTPTLEFLYDDTTDRAMRVEELLERTADDGRAVEAEEG
jgi:ribosome-binding factor A